MNKIFVLGLTPQGLSVLRVLSRAGIPVVAFYNNKRNVGRFSKYGEKFFYKDIEDLKNQIKFYLGTLDYKPLCYITSGEILASILRHYPELYHVCQVVSGPLNVIEKLAHKDQMYHIAISKGFTVSKFKTLDQYKDGDLVYPLFMKRNYEIPLFFKAVSIPNKKVLNQYLEKIDDCQKKDIIIQEYINIPTKSLKEISVQVFFSHGKSKGYLVGYQIHKLKKGLTAYLEEMDDSKLKKHIVSLCCSFMSDLDYTGFAEFEFMFDEFNNKLYFIEVNTRTCGEQSSLFYKFSNLSEILMNPFNAGTLLKRNSIVRWMNIQRDIRCRIERRNFSQLGNFVNASYDILDFKDLKPFIRQFL